MQLRQILRTLGKSTNGKIKLREILFKQRRRLQDREFWILEYTYLEKLSVFNICNKLNLSNSHYHNVLNMALAKLETLISDAEMREIIEIL